MATYIILREHRHYHQQQQQDRTQGSNSTVHGTNGLTVGLLQCTCLSDVIIDLVCGRICSIRWNYWILIKIQSSSNPHTLDRVRRAYTLKRNQPIDIIPYHLGLIVSRTKFTLASFGCFFGSAKAKYGTLST